MKNLDLNDLRVFVRVVDCSSFARAARELGVPTSTVSRTIARLEATTATRLLHRNPRSVNATTEGRAMYATTSEALHALERATTSLEPAGKQVKGALRVSAPTDLGSTFLADVVVAFCERHPLVQVEMTLTNRAVSLVSERFDLALRATTRLADASIVAKRIGTLEHALYASREYIERHGAPDTPRALANHRCIVFRGHDLEKTWKLTSKTETIDVPIRARLAGDDFGWVRAATLAAGGIALMPRVVCAREEDSGALVRVLPSFTAKGADLFLLYPSAQHVPARVAALRDFITGAFRARVVRAQGFEPR
ncbi:MAG TPA: LysR family transcriptional regulator [Polyangiaceae bacterium]|nr:LysR family transcriptional regulator [Polyangiaceae bacterium]